MDRSSRATLVLRVGTLLVAIGLAFGLVSYMSGLTVSGYHGDASQCIVFFFYECGDVVEAPAGTYTVLAGWNPASPQQMYFLNMTSAPVDAKVYILNTNETAFNVWVANKSGLPLTNLSFYGPQELVWFSDYMASHRQEVANQYSVSGINTVARHFVPDVEPLMIVLTNGNAQSSLNFTYYETNLSVTINPSLGFRATGYLAVSGGVLAGLGLVLKRRVPGKRDLSPTPPRAPS
ncbi:MAG: hypothetical protein ABSB26_04480 [Nitrososphaerales archaeon]